MPVSVAFIKATTVRRNSQETSYADQSFHIALHMAAKTTPNSPDYGRRLLLTLIDETASTTPQRKFVSVQQSDPSKTAFEDITYDAFANAVNRCSSWLEDELRRMESSKAMAYVGPQDLLYPILVIAIKTSYRVRSSIEMLHIL